MVLLSVLCFARASAATIADYHHRVSEAIAVIERLLSTTNEFCLDLDTGKAQKPVDSGGKFFVSPEMDLSFIVSPFAPALVSGRAPRFVPPPPAPGPPGSILGLS